MKLRKSLLVLLTLPLLAGCDLFGPKDNSCKSHVDANNDGYCDNCGAKLTADCNHYDGNHDGFCDYCGEEIKTPEPCTNHIDLNGDGKCDNCGEAMPDPTKDVTVYLVIGEVGLYKGEAGTSFPELFIENAVKYTANPGTALPTKSDVTHKYGSAELKNWLAYEGDGAPKAYTTVPNENNKILYANFVSNGVDPTPPGPVGETKTYTLNTSFEGGNWAQDDANIFVHAWDASGASVDKKLTKTDTATFTFEIEKTYTGCVFVRTAPTVSSLIWEGEGFWNKTNDLSVDSSTNNTAHITGWTTVVWEN